MENPYFKYEVFFNHLFFTTQSLICDYSYCYRSFGLSIKTLIRIKCPTIISQDQIISITSNICYLHLNYLFHSPEIDTKVVNHKKIPIKSFYIRILYISLLEAPELFENSSILSRFCKYL